MYYSEPLAFPSIHPVKRTSEMKPETAFYFQVNITRMLYTQIFITRSRSIFNDCTIFSITFKVILCFQ